MLCVGISKKRVSMQLIGMLHATLYHGELLVLYKTG